MSGCLLQVGSLHLVSKATLSLNSTMLAVASLASRYCFFEIRRFLWLSQGWYYSVWVFDHFFLLRLGLEL